MSTWLFRALAVICPLLLAGSAFSADIMVPVGPGNGPTSTPVPTSQGGTNGTSAKTAAANLSEVYVLCQGNVPVSLTGTTTETVLMSAPCAIPAGLLGTNGRLRLTFYGTVPGNTNTKTYKVRFSTTSSGLGAPIVAFSQNIVTGTFVGMYCQMNITNENSASAQAISQCGPIGAQASAPSFATVATASTTYLSITGQLGTTTDTMTVDSYLVELIQSAGN